MNGSGSLIRHLKFLHNEVPKRKQQIHKESKIATSSIKEKVFSKNHTTPLTSVKKKGKSTRHSKKSSLDNNKTDLIKMILRKAPVKLNFTKRKKASYQELSNNSCYNKNPYNFYGMRFHRTPRFFIWRHIEFPELKPKRTNQSVMQSKDTSPNIDFTLLDGSKSVCKK